ncbi:MAG: hypothetical protein QXS91_01970 [Candidatus Anstonellales archaeon]
MFVNPVLSIKASFLAGLKETKQFKGIIYSNVITVMLRAFLMISIWGSIFGFQNIMAYLVMLSFIILPGVMPTFRLINEYYESKIIEGWSIAFSKPLDFFLFSAFYSTGRVIISYIISIIAGIIILHYLGYEINIMMLFISILFIFIFEISIAYLLCSFVYFFYHLWGFRVVIATFYMLFSGLSFPLIYISQDFLNILQFFPFSIRGHFIALSLLNNDFLSLSKYLFMLTLFSILFFAIGYFIHKRGIKKFESQGG